MLDRLDLYDMWGYQHEKVEFIKENHFCAAWMDMGLGKSITSATALRDLIHVGEIGRSLIVAPKRVALTTWPTEFKKWKHLDGIRTQVISGNAKERTRCVLKKAEVHIVSIDNLAWLQEIAGKRWPWQMAILDESSGFKSQSSNRWKAMRVGRRHLKRMVQLSATPAPNGLQDLWAQIYLLDLGERLGSSELAFKQRWFTANPNGYGVVPREHSENEIHSLVGDIAVHMKAEDYIKMPKLLINAIEVELSPKQMLKYKYFEKESIYQLECLGTVEANNAASLVGKLLQCANGAIYTNELKEWELLHDEKIDALQELVDHHAGYPLLVAYNFKSDLQRLKKAFPDAVVMDDDQETQDRWNRGEIKMLLTHPKSSGHGLNLQGGSHIIVWFGLNWSLELYLQLIGRLYRQGQKSGTVIVHHIIARGTVDERVLKVIRRKDATQTALLEAVKSK